MANKFTRFTAMALALVTCICGLPLSIFANTPEAEEPKTIWNGDDLSAEVTAGEEGYTFMSVFRDPAHSYEISNHVLNDGNGNAIPQTLVLVDASKSYTWSPDGPYSFGTNNYEVLYCCDAVTGYVDGVHYKRLNLEDSDYYDEEQAAHIRSIITNSYPYVSMEHMKANLIAAGVEGAADMTRADLIAGVQAAVWYFANGYSDFDYLRSYNVAATPGYGKVMHDFTAEMSPAIQALGNKKTLVDSEAGKRVEALADYLKQLDKTYAEKDEIIISKLDVLGASPIVNTAGKYLTTIRVELNNSGSSANDDLKLDIYVDGVLANSREIYKGATTYDVTVAAKEGQTIKAVVSGKQIMPQGVYFYEPVGGRDVSQCLVGVASGETDVYVSREITIEKNIIPVDKFATELDNWKTDVTLVVPGYIDGLGVDIIYILGSFLSRDEVESDVMISSLADTFRELVKEGIPVRFGMVPFSSTKDPVLDFVVLDSEDDIDGLNELIADAIQKAGNVYDGVNMENALITAKEMFSKSPLASRPDRQHLVMVSSGQTYFFNSGENNENIATVPVNLYSASSSSKVANELFYSWKAWQRARNNHTNNYHIPKFIVDEYENNPEKYAGMTLWECYWSYIDQWAKADIAVGDSIVYEATARADGDFVDWFTVYKKHSDQTYFKYSSYGAVIHDATQEDIDKSVLFKPGANPFTDEAAAHAISNERAMWEAYNYAMTEIVGAGINFYPIYNELDPRYTNGQAAFPGVDYGIDQHIGHSFMNMLAGGEAITYSSTDDKAFFDPIKSEIMGIVNPGSYVEDYIGYDPVKGNFEFIVDPTTIFLNIDGVQYFTTQVEAKEGATASFVFSQEEGGEPTFWLDYYYGNGTTTERFVWTFGEQVSFGQPASLTYKLNLIDPCTIPGEYYVDTNISATLYPKYTLSSGEPVARTFSLRSSIVVDGEPVVFPVPTVSYVVSAFTSVSGTKTWDDADDQDGIRPDSIIINLLANGVEVDEVEVTAENGWQYSFENLPRFDGDKEIVYTISEDAVDGYETVIDGNNVTNTHTPEDTTVSVEKVWEDDDNSANARPESIIVELLANGVKVDSIELSDANEWAWTFTNLAKYANGEAIVYTVVEVEVENYVSTIEGDAETGFVITNIYVEEIPETTPPLNPPPTGDSLSGTVAAAAAALLLAAWVAFGKKRTA